MKSTGEENQPSSDQKLKPELKKTKKANTLMETEKPRSKMTNVKGKEAMDEEPNSPPKSPQRKS